MQLLSCANWPEDQLERIGYVAHEALALHAVYDAMDHNRILAVHFDWEKYIVYFRDRGWYAGIRKRGD